MRFATMFLPTENIHLTKDVGMIPFFMTKDHGYQSDIICYENGAYPHLSEIPGVGLDFVSKKTGKMIIDGSLYLIKNARKIDVLNIFHLEIKTMLWIVLYKMFHRKGKVYLKLDTVSSVKELKFNRMNLKHILRKRALKKCDLISAETKDIADYLNEHWPVPVAYLPNGFYDEGQRKKIIYADKQNRISHVARLGTPEKATEILLMAFAEVAAEIGDWHLDMVGSIAPGFEEYIEDYRKKYPLAASKITFYGQVSDKKVLNQVYEDSKIFVLCSKFESFGIVFVEALKNGCTILTTDVDSAQDVTKNGELGEIFPVDDVQKLAELLLKVTKNDKMLEKNCQLTQEYAYELFYWPTICDQIAKKLS